MPAGWEARGTWKGLEPRPVAIERRRLLARPVQMDTGFLEGYYNPGPDAMRYRAHADERLQLPRAAAAAPVGRQPRGSFPEGRGWFRADSRDGRWRSTQWDISWPYRCEPGVRCPALLALRTLRIGFRVEEGAAAEAADLAEHLLRSARPVTNAVAGRAHAPRQGCVDGRHLKLVRGRRRRRPLARRRWSSSGGAPGPTGPRCRAPSGTRSGSSWSTGPAAGSTCGATARAGAARPVGGPPGAAGRIIG